MAENRRNIRPRYLKSARVAFNNSNSSIDCVVRNMSDTGAALAIESPFGIPDECDLIIDGAPARPFRVVWRKPKMLGVMFVAKA